MLDRFYRFHLSEDLHIHFSQSPQVLSELKDSRAREHFERLGLMSGIKIEVKISRCSQPIPWHVGIICLHLSTALIKSSVIQWAKKTGDYSVLSHADLCVLALTYMLDLEDKQEFRVRTASANPIFRYPINLLDSRK
jgi:RNA-binding protein NOB1